MKTLKEKIVRILAGINEPPRTNYEIADQILELLKSEEKEKLLGRIKLEYDEPINRDTKWITNEQSNYWVDGYNKAVEDLERLIESIKKEIKVDGN